jgi:hypothetical protein
MQLECAYLPRARPRPRRRSRPNKKLFLKILFLKTNLEKLKKLKKISKNTMTVFFEKTNPQKNHDRVCDLV